MQQEHQGFGRDGEGVTASGQAAATEEQPGLDQLLDAAHAIGERAAAQADQADRDTKLDDGIVDDMTRARLFQVNQPRRFGGLEMGFPAQVRICQAVGQHDMAAAWVYGILSAHQWWGAFTTPELQDEMWRDDPHVMFSDCFAPTGRAERVADGYVLSGEWKFSSGVDWSGFIALGVMLDPVEGGEREYRMLFLPKSECVVLDDWDTLGMRGTGSRGIRVEKRLVPEYRTISLFPLMHDGIAPGHAYHPGALYRVPLAPGICLSLMGCYLGGAQGIRRLFHENMRKRVPTFTTERQDQMGYSQMILAESAVRLDACERLIYQYADELTAAGEALARGDEVDVMELRLRSLGWRCYVAREGRAAAAALFENAGASAIYAGTPIQRFWRDSHSIGQHVAVNYEVGMRNYARYLLGQEPLPSLY